MRFRVKPAYDTTVETTIYCAPESVGRKIGNQLYSGLFETIRNEEFIASLEAILCQIEVRKRCMKGSGSSPLAYSARMGGSLADIGTRLGPNGPYIWGVFSFSSW